MLQSGASFNLPETARGILASVWYTRRSSAMPHPNFALSRRAAHAAPKVDLDDELSVTSFLSLRYRLRGFKVDVEDLAHYK